MAHLKTHKKVTGIPSGRVAMAPGKTDLGAAQVTVLVSALDAYDMPTTVLSLRLSAAEAREIAARLVIAADASERL